MNFRHLETFVTIVECGTLTEAANRLYKTQGAVSHDLKALEQELGLSLVDRSGQRIKVTTAGEVLLPTVYDVLRRLRDVESVGRKLREGQLGVVRVGTLPSLGPYLLPHLMAFRADHPEARFTVLTELQNVLVEWLTDGRLDLALAHPELSTIVDSDHLGAEDIFVVATAESPLAQRSEISVDQIADEPFVGFARDVGGGPATAEFFRPLGRYPESAVEVEDFRLMGQLIRDGHGVGLMPASAVSTESATGLVGLALNPRISRSLAILSDARQAQSPLLGELRAWLRDKWRVPTYDPISAE